MILKLGALFTEAEVRARARHTHWNKTCPECGDVSKCKCAGPGERKQITEVCWWCKEKR